MDAQETTRQRVTSTMVALRAGVSQPTVSRVINNPRIVGGETVKRVWEAIRELGYSPAKSHALGLSNTHYPSEKFGAEFSCPPRYASAGVTAVMVAQRAGVSPATVSRVVNKRLVHPETVVRVRQAIEELGFVPSAPIAGRRRSSVKGNIALFCPDGKLEAMVRTPILNNVLHGVISALSERGLYLIQTTISDSHALLAKHEVDGIIVWPNLVGVPKAAIELLRTYPVVYVMSTPEARLPGDRVKPNNKLVGTLAAKHLLAQGHKRLACVSTTDLESWLWERSKAFLEIAKSEANDTCPSLFETIEWSGDCRNVGNSEEFEARLTTGLQRILSGAPIPTGLFVTSDALTVHVYRCLKNLGVQIGKDIEIISCNNEVPILNCLYPRPKSIDLRTEEIGRKAVERLLWRMKSPALEGSYFSVEVEPRLS